MTATDRRLGVSGSAAFKVPCRVATTANIILYGLQVIDGVTVAQDDRVLVKNQTNGIENGIYVADTGTWARAVDFNGRRDCVQGTLVMVATGTTQNGTVYQLSTASPVIGTSILTFAVTGSTALSTVAIPGPVTLLSTLAVIGALTLSGGFTSTKAMGSASGIGHTFATTITGSGATDSSNVLISTAFSGASSALQAIGLHCIMDTNHSAGTLSFGLPIDGYFRHGFYNGVSSNTVSNVSTAAWARGHIAHEGNTGTITTADVFSAGGIDLVDGNGGVGTSGGFSCANQGHTTRVTAAARGYYCADFTAGAPISAAFISDMNSGTGKWHAYWAGTARSFMQGGLTIGTTSGGSNEKVTISQTAAGATSNILRMVNASGAANTAVALSGDPGGNGFMTRDGVILFTNNGSNTITIDFLLANGGTPVSTFLLAPTLITAKANFKIASTKTLQLGNAAVTGLVAGALAATTNASLAVTDDAGQAYRIPVII